MQPQLKLIVPLFLAAGCLIVSFITKSPHHTGLRPLDCKNKNFLDSGDIVIGNRISDSSGVMTITPSDIQQSVVATISYLNGMSLSSPSLMVTPVTAYILLNGTDGSGNSVKVAIQILSNSDSSLTFNPHDRMLLHVCTQTSGCGDCQFITLGNLIFTCSCGGQPLSDTTPAGCHNESYLLK